MCTPTSALLEPTQHIECIEAEEDLRCSILIPAALSDDHLGWLCKALHSAERFKLGGAAHMRSCCDTQVEGRAGKLKTDWTNPLAPAVVLRLFYGH